MLGVEDQRDVQHAGHGPGSRVPVPVGQQVEQVFGEAARRARLDLPLGMREAVRGCDHDGDLGQQTDGLAHIGRLRADDRTLPPRARRDAPLTRGIGISHAQ